MARAGKHSTQGQLRIIGGTWRGRKLRFTPTEGLRPTSDRTRETLFNWLAPDIHGARCADLFAGSGALGLEALSRGAAHCDFVDTAASATGQIVHHLHALNAGCLGTCHTLQAGDFLQKAAQAYDIVFVDPPFGKALVEQTCALLQRSKLLLPGALVYVETSTGEPVPGMPQGWQLHREKRAGGVIFRLFEAFC